ncbi:hypothetical protein ACTMTI_35925 [Nonomuraea sp. H19]|uniref:hypothetical protein n=1 Tax=Nonomuraea sp. H19 TaxID=3452206 RepID=UPI003F8B1EF6
MNAGPYRAMHYANGEWSEIDDEVINAFPDGDSDDLRKLGFEPWLTVGDYPFTPLALEIHRRHRIRGCGRG